MSLALGMMQAKYVHKSHKHQSAESSLQPMRDILQIFDENILME